MRTLIQRARKGTQDAIKTLYGRTDAPEFEQGVIRLAFGALVLACFVWYIRREHQIDASESQVLVATILYFVASIVILARIIWAGDVSVSRRYVGMVVDNAGITYFMAMMGETGAVMFGLYLFIIFGNGFRYGRTYLHACQALGLVGFGSVLVLDSHWSNSRSVGIACFFAILVLPFYVSVLAKRITDAKSKADEANQAKGRFVANVSHEMRTPLNGVIAMADVLRETNLTDSQREIVETLGTSAHLLLAQIEDVLDLAKIEAGRVQIEQRPFDLGKLLTSSVKVVLPQARYKDLVVNTEISVEVARWFIGDSHHLRQVLLNLLANAVKFTERGSITLRVLLIRHGPSEECVRFEVHDTGIGIPPEKQESIFEPFTQADDSITRVYGGTGLGTSIARNLVTLMGGKIGVASKVGVGSLFWFELLLSPTEPSGVDLTLEVSAELRHSATTGAALTAQQPTNVQKIRGARILVAEDNGTNQRVMQLILESGGHIATMVDNGEAALDALERNRFDLAIFDVSMPGVSGVEALKLYRFTTQAPIPILMLSANVTTEVIAECQRAGCAEFLPKPIRPSILLDAIERHMERKGIARLQSAVPFRSNEKPSLAVVQTHIVDLEVLADLARISSDPTFVERLVRGFRQDAERIVKTIGEAFAARRYEDVKDAAHALKGGAGSVGATQLVQLSVRFEKASHELLRMKATVWTEELTRVTNSALTALDEHILQRQRQVSDP